MSKFLNIVVTAFSLFFAFNSLAYENTGTDAESFVKTISARVEKLLKQPIPEGEKEHNLDDIFIDITEIDWVGKYVIGRYWQNLDNSQKITYLKTYKDFLISSYVPLFKDYNGQKVVVNGVKSLGEEQYLIVTTIQPTDPKASPYKVEYRVKFNNGHFKVRDIIAEGISMLATQRSEFSSIISNNGYDALIKKLSSKAMLKE